MSTEPFFPCNIPLFRAPPGSTKAEFLWHIAIYLGRNFIAPVAEAELGGRVTMPARSSGAPLVSGGLNSIHHGTGLLSFDL